MRILFVSAVFSTPLQPERGVGNARIAHAMRAHCALQVVVPLPWYPAPLVRGVPRLRAITDVPIAEKDVDGATVIHPRTLHLPRVGRVLYAGLYAASLLGPLRAQAKRFRPDVLLSAWAFPDGTAAVALGRALGLPTVVRVMGSDINDYTKERIRRPQIAWAMRNADGVIAVSRALGQVVEGLGADPARIHFVPTGVDLAKFRPRDRAASRAAIGVGPVGDEAVVLVPGRLSPEKGVHWLLEALGELPARVRVLLVGDGVARRDLEALVDRLGLRARVRFEGFQPEARMKTYYSAADLVCLPSRAEGWPDVLMEAFACGCPVVASAVGGVPDQIELTGGGILAPAGDVPALRRALVEGLARPWDRAALAATMERFTLDQTGKDYVDVCQRAVEARR